MTDSRIVELPLSYVVHGVPAGSRNPRPIRVVDMVAVEIPQYCFQDLELALRARIDGTEIEIARVGQYFATSSFQTHQQLDKVLAQIGSVVDLVTHARLHFDAIKGFSSVFDLTAGDAVESMLHEDIGTVRNPSRSNETMRRSRFWNEVVPRLAIVDGHFVRLGDEPAWEVWEHNGQAVLGFAVDPEARSYAWRFPVDRRDFAVAFGEENYGGIKLCPVGIDVVGEQEWRHDSIDSASDRLAYSMMNGIDDSMALSLMRTGSTDFFQAFAVLREGRRSTLADRGAAVRVLRSLIDASDGEATWPSGLQETLSRWAWIEGRSLEFAAGAELSDFRI